MCYVGCRGELPALLHSVSLWNTPRGLHAVPTGVPMRLVPMVECKAGRGKAMGNHRLTLARCDRVAVSPTWSMSIAPRRACPS
jgi:hypothetical protein